jgi:radical S-adenosyl methionine domain-containing protein 2
VRALGIRLKLNTVVTSLNWQQDLSGLVRAVRPERWKVFQVLPMAGQNDGVVEPLLVTPEQFASFTARHAGLAAEGFAPVAEDNDAMTGSYVIVDPLGRIVDNTSGRHRYSRPILEVGPATALAETRFSLLRLVARNGLYAWGG